jgi:superfamily II DNA or RNA helicase
VQLVIGSHLWVPRTASSPAVFEALLAWATARYVFDNPAYWDARKHRRPCRHLPRTMAVVHLDDAGLTLPRGAGLDLKKWLAAHAPGEPIEVVDQRSAPPLTTPVQLTAELRGYQSEAVEQAVLRRDGVLVAPTGSGKTLMALAIAARLQVRTLVVVHTRTLLDQTCASMARHLGIEAGRLGGGRDDLRELTVATVQTLVRRPPAELADYFGLVILDEAHHCPAATFTDVMQRFSARWRLGLTATPERADRLHPLMYAALGPELARLRPIALVDEGAILAPLVRPVLTHFRAARVRDRGRLLTRLCLDGHRNDLIARTIAASRGHRSLVLSERVEHCATLTGLLRALGVPAQALTGKLAVEDRERVLADFRAGPPSVLVATTSLVGEGFDCPELDTLFLASPTGNATRATQALGRVLRPAPGKTAPQVYDFVDSQTPALERAWRKRVTIYRRHQAEFGEPLGGS